MANLSVKARETSWGVVHPLVDQDGVPGQGKAVLQPSDISFVGWFLLPTVTSTYAEQFTFSFAPLATRLPGSGARRFFTSTFENFGYNYGIVEFIDPESYSTTLNGSTPRATTEYIWGDLYQGKRVLAESRAHYLFGLFYKDGVLYWQFDDKYNGSSTYYHTNLGATSLNHTTKAFASYGPWRVGQSSGSPVGYAYGSYQYADWMMDIPSGFANAYLGGKTTAIGGSAQHSGYQTTAYGPTMHVLDALPSISAPADAYESGGTTGASTVKAFPLMLFDQSHPATTSLDTSTLAVRQYRTSERPMTQEGYPITYASNDGTWSNGASAVSSAWASQLDEARGAVWVDTGTKHGVVYFSILTDSPPWFSSPGDPDGLTHYGYGDPEGTAYGRPLNYCCHGQEDSSWGATGPFATVRTPWVHIVNPDELIPVSAGTRSPHEVPIAHSVRMKTQWPTFSDSCTSAPKYGMGSWSFGQAVYDSTRQYIFVAVRAVDDASVYYAQPAIAVFSVS